MLKRLALHSHNRYLSNLWNPFIVDTHKSVITCLGDLSAGLPSTCIARTPPPSSLNFSLILNNQKVQAGGCTFSKVTQ